MANGSRPPSVRQGQHPGCESRRLPRVSSPCLVIHTLPQVQAWNAALLPLPQDGGAQPCLTRSRPVSNLHQPDPGLSALRLRGLFSFAPPEGEQKTCEVFLASASRRPCLGVRPHLHRADLATRFLGRLFRPVIKRHPPQGRSLTSSVPKSTPSFWLRPCSPSSPPPPDGVSMAA